VVAAILFLSFWTPGALAQTDYDNAIQSQQTQLDDLRRQAEQKWARARKYATEEKSVLLRLKKSEQALEASRRYIQGLEQREAIMEDEIRRTDKRLGTAHQNLEAKREALRRRVVHVHKHGRARSLEVLFTASTFPELMERSAFLARVLQQDRRLVTEVESHETEVQSTLNKLRVKREEIDRLQMEKESEKTRYENQRKTRQRDLEKARSQRAVNENAARDLEQAAKQMEAVLAELERKRMESQRRRDPVLVELDREDFRRNRGRLPWPVNGEVIGEYGRHVHPKYETVTLNNGIDIRAPIGTAVTGVGHGVVEMVQWLSGYGQSIIVNHGRGYYSIYAHLSAVQVVQGDRVAPGQVIGAVGDTGSLKGACLHFEVRNGSVAEDPRHWLR